MLSYGRIACPQFGQWDPGWDRLSRRGSRHTTTLRKEPMSMPKRPTHTRRNAFTVVVSPVQSPSSLPGAADAERAPP